MSNFITNSFQEENTQLLRMFLQQKGSKLRQFVTEQTHRGEGAQVADYLKEATSQKNRASKSDTQYSDIDTERRWVYPNSYSSHILVDQLDKLKTLNDPSNQYLNHQVMRLGRDLDDEIIAAFFATAKTGKNGGTNTTFPAAQVVGVDVGGTTSGLNVEKLLSAREILMANEVDMDFEELICPISAKQERNLQNEIKATNKDYNAMYDTTTGKLSRLYNIQFVHTERLDTDGNSYRRVPLYAKSGMHLGVWQDVTTTIHSQVATKNNNAQYSAEMMAGATRLEEGKVVEIKCAE